MFVVVCILLGMLILSLGVNYWLLCCIEDAEEARKRAVREGGDWAWTSEKERMVESALELCCSICHEPWRCKDQEELDEACAVCPMRDALWALAAGEEERE